MKLSKKKSTIQGWKTTSVAGFGLSGIGLAALILIIGQLLPAVLGGQVPQISSLEIALEGVVAIVLLISGFTLMVVGADPFEDASADFDFHAEREQNF